jgi:hypothetical protein
LRWVQVAWYTWEEWYRCLPNIKVFPINLKFWCYYRWKGYRDCTVEMGLCSKIYKPSSTMIGLGACQILCYCLKKLSVCNIDTTD